MVKGRFKRLAWFLSIAIIVLVLLAVGCRRTGMWLVKENIPGNADALILLMGNFPERVMEAVDLYYEDRAGKMIIVQEGMGPYRLLESKGADILSTTEQVYKSAVALGIPEDSITILPGEARSTLNEAVIISEYLADKPDIDTIILVSSPTHMRRASMIFQSAFKKRGMPVYVGCIPSSYSGFQPDKWWRRKEDAQAVVAELVKIVSFELFEKKQLNERNTN